MPVPRKPPTTRKKAPAKPRAGTKGAKATASAAAKKKADAAAADAAAAGATGGRISAAKQQLRDNVIVTRRIQNVPWDRIGEEVGLTGRQCRRVFEQAQAQPMPTTQSPVKLVNDLLMEYRGSISTYEAMAFELIEKNPAVALGAKKAADETRRQVIAILADVGMFPSDLQQFRSEAEMERIAGELLGLAMGIADGTKTAADMVDWMRGLTMALPASVEPMIDATTV